jgi:predicted flap endonuclease-1-like 5' DNA nuclease
MLRSLRALLTRWMLALLFVSAGSGAAFASHYYLVDVDFLEGAELEVLQGRGWMTTEDVLAALATPELRAQAGEVTGLDASRIEFLARTCDLLQVDGIGPRAVRLVRAAGVIDAGDLAARDPAELLLVLMATNAQERLTEVDPGIEHVRDWVASAVRREIVATW